MAISPARRTAKPTEMVTAPSSSLVERRRERARADLLADGLKGGLDLGLALLREDDGELFAAVAGGDARRIGHPAHDAGDVAQHLVAGLVAPGVVEVT